MPTVLSRKSGMKNKTENKEKLFHLQKYRNLGDFGPNNNMEHKFLRPGEEDAVAAASPACPAPPAAGWGAHLFSLGWHWRVFKVVFEQDFPSQAQFCSLSCGSCARRG